MSISDEENLDDEVVEENLIEEEDYDEDVEMDDNMGRMARRTGAQKKRKASRRNVQAA